jgi:hypothetical protein
LRRLAILGLALTLVGLILVVGYWPLTTVSGAELAAAWDGDEYRGYPVGSRITIHERILNIDYNAFFGTTSLELDDGNPDVATSILVRGNASTAVRPNDVVYMDAVLQQAMFGLASFLFWEVATPQDIHPSWPIDAMFYGIMAVGVAILALAALRKK